MTSYSSENQPVPWKATDVAVATALVFVVFAGFLVFQIVLDLAIGIDGAEERTLLNPWVIGMFEGLMLVAVWVFGIKKYNVRWRTLGLRRPEGRLSFMLPWLALLGSLVFYGIYGGVLIGLGLDSFLPPPIPGDVLGSGLSRLANTLVIVLWGPFAEEAFFRGFLLAALLRTLGPLRAAAISAAVFAAAHLTLSSMVPIFVTGLLLAWLYIRTRSIWPPITAHAAQNLIAVSLAS